MDTLLDLPLHLRPGNVVSVTVLRRYGITKTRLRTLARRGTLTHLRRGWYALPGADADVVRAVASGGVLGCVSALVARGAWDPLTKRVHAYRTDKGRRQPRGGLAWCPTGLTREALELAVAPIDIAVSQTKRCVTTEEFLAMVESLIHRRVLRRDEAVTRSGRWVTAWLWRSRGQKPWCGYVSGPAVSRCSRRWSFVTSEEWIS